MDLEQFDIDFRESDSPFEKQQLIYQLENSDIDFSILENKELLIEYREQLKDYINELAIHEDMLINFELEQKFPSKYELYTCIKQSDRFTEGYTYYIKYTDLNKVYRDTQIADTNPILAEYFSKVKPVCHIILDNGLGTLKRKEVLSIEEFENNFTKYRYE